MGIVYLATYVETGKQVAVKVLPPALSEDEKLLKRFEREILILKRLRHPNIVKYYGGGQPSGSTCWYAMEYIDGGSLHDILKKRKRLSWDQAIQVGRQLTAALEHAHNAGIIHRDLKPGNLFVTKKGRIKLGDFGIARDTEATALTAAEDGRHICLWRLSRFMDMLRSPERRICMQQVVCCTSCLLAKRHLSLPIPLRC